MEHVAGVSGTKENTHLYVCPQGSAVLANSTASQKGPPPNPRQGGEVPRTHDILIQIQI